MTLSTAGGEVDASATTRQEDEPRGGIAHKLLDGRALQSIYGSRQDRKQQLDDTLMGGNDGTITEQRRVVGPRREAHQTQFFCKGRCSLIFLL
jgi:hypothetical protein